MQSLTYTQAKQVYLPPLMAAAEGRPVLVRNRALRQLLLHQTQEVDIRDNCDFFYRTHTAMLVPLWPL